MSAESSFLLPNSENQCAIQIKCAYGGAPGRGQTGQAYALPLEMLRPHVIARVVKSRLVAGFRIDSPLTRALSERAGDTRQGKILSDRLALGGDGSDVINVKSSFLPCLR